VSVVSVCCFVAARCVVASICVVWLVRLVLRRGLLWTMFCALALPCAKLGRITPCLFALLCLVRRNNRTVHATEEDPQLIIETDAGACLACLFASVLASLACFVWTGACGCLRVSSLPAWCFRQFVLRLQCSQLALCLSAHCVCACPGKQVHFHTSRVQK
jgi:hypothetical protein